VYNYHMDKQTKQELPIEVSDSIRTGVFATYFYITMNPDFAVIDFGSPLPEPGIPDAKRNLIVSRVITTKAGAKQLADLIYGLFNKSESSQPEPR